MDSCCVGVSCSRTGIFCAGDTGAVNAYLGNGAGLSRSFISGIGAMALVVMAMLAPFVGVIADRSGPRLTLAIGLVVLAIGFFTIAITNSAIVFGLAFGGLSAVAFGMVSTTAVGVAITKLFPDRLGVAIGIATSGATAVLICTGI